MKYQMKSEKEYVVSCFEKKFAKHKLKKTIIYGVGKNTKIILDEFPEHNIVALLDETRIGENIFGKPVISVEEAIEQGVELIIIVARASNVPIIYRRISDLCEKNKITVYDINGNVVKVKIETNKSFEDYKAISKLNLKDKIKSAEIVSFDIFDTLVMRKVLYPKDIFMLMEKEVGNDFAKRRVKSESKLYEQGINPKIDAIYEELSGTQSDMEIELEFKNLIRREEMCKMIDYARLKQKEVYAVSDMYLPKEIIHKLFLKLNINIKFENIIVSCEYNISKYEGLFNELRSKVGNKKILHIGDNKYADIISAKEYGIDDTFEIRSAICMLQDSYASEILNYDKCLENRLILGEFISRKLNDPFLFSETNGKFKIDSSYDLAYSFIGPLIYRFFAWMIETANELKIDLILLSARDGCIIEQVARLLQSKNYQFTDMKYFYTSRAVATLASIKNDEDILHVANLAYAGNVQELLINRFNINPINIKKYEDNIIKEEDYILLHREEIFKEAEIARENYLKYINLLNIKKDMRIGFFDFVSSGTCQKGLRNILNNTILGLYFVAVNNEVEYKSDTDIYSMFGNLNVFQSGYKILYDYLFLEKIMTSNETTLKAFNEFGKPIFEEQNVTSEKTGFLNNYHNGILEYIENCQLNLENLTEVDIGLVDLLAHFINNEYAVDMDKYRELELIDEFCNRKFKL